MQQLGADVDALDALARTFNQESRRLLGSVSIIDANLHSAWWAGNDANRFHGEWTRDHATSVRSVAQLLADASRALTTQSRQQRTASSGNDVSVALAALSVTAAGEVSGPKSADAIAQLETIDKILGGGDAAAKSARQSVVNAASALSHSPDPDVRSAAGYILSKYGKDSHFIDSKAFKVGSHGLEAIGIVLDVAKYSSQHKAVLEVVGRPALNFATTAAATDVGAEIGAGIGTMIAPGPGTLIGAGIGGLVGFFGGSELADKAGEILFEQLPMRIAQ